MRSFNVDAGFDVYYNPENLTYRYNDDGTPYVDPLYKGLWKEGKEYNYGEIVLHPNGYYYEYYSSYTTVKGKDPLTQKDEYGNRAWVLYVHQYGGTYYGSGGYLNIDGGTDMETAGIFSYKKRSIAFYGTFLKDYNKYKEKFMGNQSGDGNSHYAMYTPERSDGLQPTYSHNTQFGSYFNTTRNIVGNSYTDKIGIDISDLSIYLWIPSLANSWGNMYPNLERPASLSFGRAKGSNEYVQEIKGFEQYFHPALLGCKYTMKILVENNGPNPQNSYIDKSYTFTEKGFTLNEFSGQLPAFEYNNYPLYFEERDWYTIS